MPVTEDSTPLRSSPTFSEPRPGAALTAPAWLDALCPPPAQAVASSLFDLHVSLALPSAGREIQDCLFARTSARVKNALLLSAAQLEEQVGTLYAEVFTAMAATPTRHAVRLWNGLPHIIEQLPATVDLDSAWDQNPSRHEKFDRYMAFNMGRFRAFLAYCGSIEALGRVLTAATGIGHGDPDLVVHGLFSDTPGVPVENPRQTSAWRYSSRFGPMPPCFARATRIEVKGRSLLMVSGTASIVGEETLHAGATTVHVCRQAEETFRNLAALLASGGLPLSALYDARVYVAQPRDFAIVEQLCHAQLPGLRTLELVHAEICRPGLSLEIEGIAA